LISRSPEQLYIEAPAVVVVEATREDLNGRLEQCVAEMIAAQRFNEQNQSPISVIHAAVTTGDRWKFLKLEEQGNNWAARVFCAPLLIRFSVF
jgi:hypothetical protein